MMAVDMAVFGPYGKRRERAYTMTAYFPNADGHLVAKELSGPQTLDEWVSAWDFATSGFVHAGLASTGVCEDYRDMFKELCEVYPRCWFIGALAEWEFRFEQAPR